MILTIDIGNSQIVLGAYNDDILAFTSRISTDSRKSADQYAVLIKEILALHNCPAKKFKGCVVGSVVPEITQTVKQAVSMITKTDVIVLSHGVKTKLNIRTLNPAEVGADLVATAVAAKDKYPCPCLIWDLGTATKISVLDRNGSFIGCTISPGINMGIKALSTDTSQLNPIEISQVESAIGNNTFKSISSGIILGTAVMLEGLSEKIKKEMGEEKVTIVATGGLSKIVLNNVNQNVIYDENLILDGLKLIYDYNS